MSRAMCEGWPWGPHGARVLAGLPSGPALCSNHTTAPQLRETGAGSGHLYTVCVPWSVGPGCGPGQTQSSASGAHVG